MATDLVGFFSSLWFCEQDKLNFLIIRQFVEAEGSLHEQRVFLLEVSKFGSNLSFQSGDKTQQGYYLAPSCATLFLREIYGNVRLATVLKETFSGATGDVFVIWKKFHKFLISFTSGFFISVCKVPDVSNLIFIKFQTVKSN